MTQKKWYAVYTRSRTEKKVLFEMEQIGIQAYLPLITTLRQWSDRKKKVEVPLIPSYIFVKIYESEIQKVLSLPAAVRFIMFEGKKVAIPENQITAIQTMIEKNPDITATNQHIKKGDNVRIASGPLNGLKGEVVEVDGKQKFVLRIDIGYTLIINIQNSEIVKF